MPAYYQPGRYVCRATRQELASTTNGHVQFVLHFMVLGTPDPANPDNYIPSRQQYERAFRRVLNNNTLAFAMEDLKALGFDCKGFGRLDPKTPGFHNFRDQEVEMYCSHKQYNGKPQEEWSVARAAAKSPGAVKAEALAQLDELVAKRGEAKQ